MSLLGTAAVLAGVGLLWLSWSAGRDAGTRWRPAARAGGWLLLALSLWPWMTAAGVDRGVALALLAMACIGLLLVGALGLRHRRQHAAATRMPRTPRAPAARDKVRAEPAEGVTPRRRLLRRAWIVVLAGPASGLAAGLIAFSAYRAATGLAAADRVTLLMLAAPLLWAVLALVATYGTALARRNAIIGVGLIIGCTATALLQLTGV